MNKKPKAIRGSRTAQPTCSAVPRSETFFEIAAEIMDPVEWVAYQMTKVPVTPGMTRGEAMDLIRAIVREGFEMMKRKEQREAQNAPPKLSLRDLEISLVRHGVIQADSIDDAEGYDEGRTRDLVLKVYEDLTGMVKQNNTPHRSGGAGENHE